MPVVYAIILNYNCSEESIRLFKDLKKNHPNELKILVIDNNSNSAEKSKLVANIPAENLIFNSRNLGYAGGNNVGIENALEKGAEFIWILNPDIEIEKDTLSELLKTFGKFKKLAAAGPRIIKREDRKKIFSDGGIVLDDKKCTTLHKHTNEDPAEIPPKLDKEISYIDGSCILLNSKAIREIGNFPEEYFLYFEETDWCLSARLNNYELVINSNAVVYNMNSHKGKVYNFYTMRNRLLFSRKFQINFKEVRQYYGLLLLNELVSKFKGEYLSPFYLSKVKGYLSGIFKTFLF